MKYTYNNKYEAHLLTSSGQLTNKTVIIPDQVYEDQKSFDGKSFTTLKGKRVKLVGEDYDLNGSGTGDICVRSV